MSSIDDTNVCSEDISLQQSPVVAKPCEPEKPVGTLELDFGDGLEDDKLDLVAKVHASGAVFACFHKAVVKLDGEASPMQMKLSSDADCLAVSDDGRKVVVGLRCGEIVIVHFEIEATIIYSRAMPGDFPQSDDARLMVEIVLRRRGKGVYDIVVIMATGQVLRLRDVDLEHTKTPDDFNYSGDLEVLREYVPGEKTWTDWKSTTKGKASQFKRALADGK